MLNTVLASLLAAASLLLPGDHIPDIAAGGSSTLATEAAPAAQEPSSNADAAAEAERPDFIPGGQSAVRREIFLQNQKVGHELVTVEFVNDHRAIVTQTAEFDGSRADLDGQRAILDALKLNGFDEVILLDHPTTHPSQEK
ncbi:hypothetical protein ACUY3K_05650 [Corynebacterium uberis]|uniref:hypothetical protein n=1 Tax=Corynebacterium TaxID=1716 RepID=UPI001D0A4DD4|nr:MULTISPECIES: hypothetical protein [Corynebacterium]MCZ9310057.1 hypothetical protein [Corynebacterium sp. c6VSa_13]UDL73805.1 hypothetical protein LH391_00785 [Corynebacterium uberis]UDL75312.1 hypothetical protein LH393_08625 [Corynebacterium uberis]UDL77523.1 hypothetical protein LH394_08605 [Corynebacterium uberis]UDL79810.1 hypothetical protein LH392_09040 [Corynebacterium uberis]